MNQYKSLYTIEQLEENLVKYAKREDISNVLVVYKNACRLSNGKPAQIEKLINDCEEAIISMCKQSIKKKAGY